MESGRMSANWSALMRPLVPGPATKCMDTTLDVFKSSSRLTAFAFSAAARSAVIRGLHATTFMPNAAPTRATRLPIAPKPIMPRRSPESMGKTDMASRQPPEEINLFSSIKRFDAPRMSAQVSSAVVSLEGPPGVHAMGMFLETNADASRVPLRSPVNIKNLSFGKRAIIASLKGDRSLTMAIASASLTAS